MDIWFLYLIRCRDGSLYTGITTDIKRRFNEHLEGGRKGSKYLRGKAPLELVLKRKIGSKSLALQVENIVKRLTKTEKEMFVSGKINMRHINKQLTKHQTKGD
jgi:putative endonuclease